MAVERRWCIVWTWGDGQHSDHRVLGPFTEPEADTTWSRMVAGDFPGHWDIEPMHTLADAQAYLEGI